MLIHSYFGTYLNLYHKSETFDLLLHLFGTYSFTLFYYSLLNHFSPKPNSINIREIILIISLGIAIGTVFELFEFLYDLFNKPSSHSQLGLVDTNLDLIFNIIGAFLASLHIYL